MYCIALNSWWFLLFTRRESDRIQCIVSKDSPIMTAISRTLHHKNIVCFALSLCLRADLFYIIFSSLFVSSYFSVADFLFLLLANVKHESPYIWYTNPVQMSPIYHISNSAVLQQEEKKCPCCANCLQSTKCVSRKNERQRTNDDREVEMINL